MFPAGLDNGGISAGKMEEKNEKKIREHVETP
jgi:hypothetical protein